MKVNELKRGMKVWCWWASRNLYFKCQNTVTGLYVFEDICDVRFEFTADQVEKLRRNK